MENTYARSAVMSMIQRKGIPTAVLLPVPNLPIYPMTGFAPSAERARAILKRNRGTRHRGDQSDDVLF
jgi:hypothetical protein